MRILFVSNRGLFPIVDGHTRRSSNILKMLSDLHEVSFVSLYETKDEISKENIEILHSICKRVEFYKAPSKRIGFEMLSRLIYSVFSPKPYIVWRHYSHTFYNRIKELANSKDYDLMLLDNLPIAYCQQSKINISQVLTDHDVSYLKCKRMAEQKTNLFNRLFYTYEAYKLKRYERKIISKVDLCIAVSKVDKDSLKALNPNANISVIENGVDIEQFSADNSNTSPTELLWLGGFSNGPNKESIKFYIEKIHHLISNEVPRIRLNILGGGDVAWLTKLTKKIESIDVCGYVDDIIPYANKAGIFIAPITSGSGTKLKVIEAMALGKAIVTTTIGCEGIDGAEGKEYLIADTPLEFSNAVIRLTKDNDLRISLGINARKYIEAKFDWKIINTKLEKTFALLAQKGTVN